MEEMLVGLLQNVSGIGTVVESLPTWTKVAGVVVLVANAITSATPSKLDDKYSGMLAKGVNMLLKFLNMLSVNFGKNKNADDK